MPALLVDIPDDVRKRRVRQKLGSQHEKPIGHSRNHYRLPSHRLLKSNPSGGFGGHLGEALRAALGKK